MYKELKSQHEKCKENQGRIFYIKQTFEKYETLMHIKILKLTLNLNFTLQKQSQLNKPKHK